MNSERNLRNIFGHAIRAAAIIGYGSSIYSQVHYLKKVDKSFMNVNQNHKVLESLSFRLTYWYAYFICIKIYYLLRQQPDAGRIADQDKEKYEKEFDQYYKELEQAKQE